MLIGRRKPRKRHWARSSRPRHSSVVAVPVVRCRSRSLARACKSRFACPSNLMPAESKVISAAGAFGGGGGSASLPAALTEVACSMNGAVAMHPSLGYSHWMEPLHPFPRN